jgi:glycosyltransferase involved in cell wall biosynthesis
LRIAQLTDCYLPVLNGVTNLVRTHKAQLERLGHQSPVFTAGHLDYADEDPNIVRSWGIPLGDSGYCVAPGYSRWAQVRLATMDLLHAHHPFFVGRLALRYGRRFGRPVVYTNHTRLDLYAGVYVPRPLRGLARWLLRLYLPRFAAQCDLVIAPSAGLAAVMRERWGVRSPVAVVPNGIDLARFRRAPSPASRAELDLPPAGPLVIYTGRLGAEKNLAFLLQAFARAAPSDLDARLLLVGDGSQAAPLRALVGHLGLAERVIFVGAVPYERVPAYLAAADLFVSASVSEVHPMSLIEALAAGLPALGVVSPGVADTIEDGVNGLLTSHDLTAFSGALRRLLVDASLRACLAEGARQTGARYSIERTTDQIVAHYQQLLRNGTQMPTDKHRSNQCASV